MRNLVWIVFDSCRYDSFMKAKSANIRRLGEPDRRFSYASWTVPSHMVYLMGASPHSNPQGVFASEVYRKDFTKWSDRLGIPDITFKQFVPQLSMPAFLKKYGYATHALVSMPVLNPTTLFNQHFDRYNLMKSHNDFSAIIDQISFNQEQPSYYFINVGETHYPYTLPGESGEDLPRIHGVHGVFKHMDDKIGVDKTTDEERFFDAVQMKLLHDRQIRNVDYLDGLMSRLYDISPPDTYFIVTSDHGELFGEGGFFGHGPVVHPLVQEVFFVEGKRP